MKNGPQLLRVGLHITKNRHKYHCRKSHDVLKTVNFYRASSSSSSSSYFICQKSGQATRKAEAHHTLVAHYIMIVNVKIKTYNTHINLQTFKASIPYHTLHTDTHTDTKQSDIVNQLNSVMHCRNVSVDLRSSIFRKQLYTT